MLGTIYECGSMNERALRQLAHVPRLAIVASSSETARDTNRTIILELIRLAGAVSRADLARLSGLQRSTASAIVEELLVTRWICEGEIGFSKHGRKPLMLAERWFGSLSGVQDAVAINVSEGIGTGILAGGHLISGWNGMAGEFGHMRIETPGIVRDCVLRGRGKCNCG